MSGLYDELRENFQNNNAGVDMYIFVGKQPSAEQGYTVFYDPDKFSKIGGFKTEISDMSLMASSIRNRIMTHFGVPIAERIAHDIIENTFVKGRAVVVIVISEDLVEKAQNDETLIPQVSFVLAHEWRQHALDTKDRVNDTPGDSEHKDYYTEEWYKAHPEVEPFYSPSYEDIPKESKAGKDKEKIEKAFQLMKTKG